MSASNNPEPQSVEDLVDSWKKREKENNKAIFKLLTLLTLGMLALTIYMLISPKFDSGAVCLGIIISVFGAYVTLLYLP